MFWFRFQTDRDECVKQTEQYFIGMDSALFWMLNM